MLVTETVTVIATPLPSLPPAPGPDREEELSKCKIETQCEGTSKREQAIAAGGLAIVPRPLPACECWTLRSVKKRGSLVGMRLAAGMSLYNVIIIIPIPIGSEGAYNIYMALLAPL